METQQEITHHEEELRSLLTRVLREPLRPLQESLQALVTRLDELEDQIEKIREEDLASLHLEHEERETVLGRLHRTIDDRLGVSESTFRGLLSSSVTQLTQTSIGAFDAMRVWSVEGAQEQRNALADVLATQFGKLGERYERSLISLREQIDRGGDARWQRGTESFKLIEANLGQRLTNLEAAFYQMDTARRTGDEAQEAWRAGQEKWQSASIERAQAHLSEALRPLRNMLIVTLALTGASLIGLVFVGARVFI